MSKPTDPILLVQHEVAGQTVCNTFTSYAEASEVYGTMNKEEWFLVDNITDRKSFVAKIAVGRTDKADAKNKKRLEKLRADLAVILEEIAQLEGE